MCQAEERNQQALYEIGRQRTEDALSLHRLERILQGEQCNHQDPQGSFLLPKEQP